MRNSFIFVLIVWNTDAGLQLFAALTLYFIQSVDCSFFSFLFENSGRLLAKKRTLVFLNYKLPNNNMKNISTE